MNLTNPISAFSDFGSRARSYCIPDCQFFEAGWGGCGYQCFSIYFARVWQGCTRIKLFNKGLSARFMLFPWYLLTNGQYLNQLLGFPVNVRRWMCPSLCKLFAFGWRELTSCVARYHVFRKNAEALFDLMVIIYSSFAE